jgi:hypothetical protein
VAFDKAIQEYELEQQASDLEEDHGEGHADSERTQPSPVRSDMEVLANERDDSVMWKYSGCRLVNWRISKPLIS